MTFMKKQAAMIAICAALLMCVAAAGSTSSTSSSPNASAPANSSSQAANASATATPTPTATTPTATTPTATTPTATTPTATTPTATTPTATPTPGSAGHVTISALPGCEYCEAAIANYQAQGYTVTVLYPGDPGFVNNATSYPVIVPG